MNNLENHDADAAASVSDVRTATTAHTPGPWRIEEVQENYRLVIGAGEWHIAEVRPSASFHNDKGEEESTANARLIAAAPDLLSSAQHLSKLCNGIYAQISPLEIDALQIAWRAMDEAIAKATGAA